MGAHKEWPGRAVPPPPENYGLLCFLIGHSVLSSCSCADSIPEPKNFFSAQGLNQHRHEWLYSDVSRLHYILDDAAYELCCLENSFSSEGSSLITWSSTLSDLRIEPSSYQHCLKNKQKQLFGEMVKSMFLTLLFYLRSYSAVST